MKKYKPYLNRVDLVKNQVEREELREQEAKRKRSRSIQEQNRQRWLKYQEQLRSELAARYFHAVQSTGGESFSNTKSLQFDGIDDFVDIGNPNNLSTITSISISAWFKTTDTAGGLVIVGSDDNTQGRRYILMTHNSSGIKLRFLSFSSNNSFNEIIGTTNINDGQWHHVLAINNGTNLKIYVDGVLDNSNTNGNLINTTFATPDINIGRRSYSGVERYFDGSIDEVAIWSSDQSANASAIGGTIPTDLSTYNPISWWRFEGSGTTAIDSGSGGNDGTINGATRDTDTPG